MKLLILCWLTVISMGALVSCDDDDDDLGPTETAEFKAFNEDMRELWTDHVVWTRNVIINVMDGAPGTTEAVNRLLKNQEDIGNAIKPYYGDAAGEELEALLKEHINLAATLLTSAKAGDTETFNTTNTAWYVNADEIAAFLNGANPDHFDLEEMQDMMDEHLDLTLQEAVARLEGDYDADIAAFDLISNQILEMADMLAEGIARQFPDKF